MRRSSVCGCPSKSSHDLIGVAVALDDQRVAFPASDRIAHPRGIGIWLERAAVHEDLAVHQVVVQQDDERRRLDDAGHPVTRGQVDRPERQAQRLHAVLAELETALLVERIRPGGHVAGLEVHGDVVVVVVGAVVLPQAREVRLAVSGARRRRRQVRLAVRKPRKPRRRQLQPLGAEVRRGREHHAEQQEEPHRRLHRTPLEV